MTSEQNERMTSEQIEEALEGLYRMRLATEHSSLNGKRLGTAMDTITQLRADLSAARVKNRELNRREQSAMVAFRSAQEAIEKAKQEDGFRWAGGNLGRAFLAFDNNELRKDLSAARADAEAKGKLLAEAVEAGLNKWESREAAVCPEGYRFEEVIGQLRVDIAIAYERAEKAESEASRYESLHIRCSEAYVTVRNQLALAEQQRDAAVSGLEKIASRSVQPKRHNPHQDMAYQLDGYEAIARNTLSRLTRDATASPKNPDADASGEGVGK